MIFNKEAFKKDLFDVIKESKGSIQYWECKYSEIKLFMKTLEPSFVPKEAKTLRPENVDGTPLSLDRDIHSILQIARNHTATMRDLLCCMEEIVKKDMYDSYI